MHFFAKENLTDILNDVINQIASATRFCNNQACVALSCSLPL